MKKYFIMLLVLGISAMASASVSIGNVPAGPILVNTTITLNIVSDSSEQSGYEGAVFVAPNSVGTLSNGTMLAAAGTPLGSISGLMTYPKGTGYIIIAGSTNNDLSSGIQFTVDFSSATTGTAVINLYQPGAVSTPVSTATITVIVPEPMTIGLLGIGALFMRKRKQ